MNRDFIASPFVCEWCNTVLLDCRGVKREGSVVTGVGYCPKCGTVLWSKPIHLPMFLPDILNRYV